MLDTVTPVVRVKRLNDVAELPERATPGAACFDLKSTLTAIIHPGKSKVFDTGLAFEVPLGYVMRVYSRSGHGFKNSVRLGNCVGIIDSDYRGEVKVCLRNDGTEPLKIWIGDRIAQAELAEVVPLIFKEADALSETERGEGGIGSTGS